MGRVLEPAMEWSAVLMGSLEAPGLATPSLVLGGFKARSSPWLPGLSIQLQLSQVLGQGTGNTGM